jgi:hypothetical protein
VFAQTKDAGTGTLSDRRQLCSFGIYDNQDIRDARLPNGGDDAFEDTVLTEWQEELRAAHASALPGSRDEAQDASRWHGCLAAPYFTTM